MLKKAQIDLAIDSFLLQQSDKATLNDTKELVKIEKSIEDMGLKPKRAGEKDKWVEGLIKELKETQDKIAHTKTRHTKEAWIKNASENLARTVTFGTHISKGIHSSSKGDNAIFKQSTNGYLPISVVGTHNVRDSAIDMTGNAAALPLYNFLEITVGSEKIKDLIIADDPVMISALSNNPDNAAIYHALLKSPLTEGNGKPKASQLNKQVLFPVAKHLDDNEAYINIIPLFPSVLTYAVYQKLGGIRNAKTPNADASKNRYDKSVPATEQKPYVKIYNLARLSLGGSQPQNVSKLISAQSGSVKLLPCLPPKIFDSKKYHLSKSSTSFFNHELYSRTLAQFDELTKALAQNYHRPNAASKKRLANAIEIIAISIFESATRAKNNPAGWLSEHDIPLAHKFWLDPNYHEQEGNEYLAKKRATVDWQDAILNDAARFINKYIKAISDADTQQFNDDAVADWKAVLRDVANDYKLKGRGVLL